MTIQYLLDIIRIDFLATFGIYSLMVFILKLRKWKPEIISKIDDRIVNSIPLIGIIWFTIFIFQDLFLDFTESQTLYTPEYRNLIIIQYLIWLILTQLFRVKFIRINYLFRFLISLIFFLDIERIDLLMIVLSKNGIPDTWFFNGESEGIFKTVFPYELLFLGIITKFILFVSINYLFKYFESKRTKHIL